MYAVFAGQRYLMAFNTLSEAQAYMRKCFLRYGMLNCRVAEMYYFPTGRKSDPWTEIWKNEEGKEVKVLERESGIPYRVVPGDGTPSFSLTMEEYCTARKEGLAL